MESDAVDPRSALADVDEVRTAVGSRVASPWWFHAGLGVLVAQQALVAGLVGGNWTIPSFVALVVGATALVVLVRRVTGITVAWPRGPRGQGVMAARVLAALACIWAAALVDRGWLVVVIAVVALAVTVLLGVAYDGAVRRDIERGLAST